MKTNRVLLCAAIAAVSACKVQIETPVEGGVTTTSTAIECASNQSCTVDVSDTFFNETFEADPAPGWHFAGWKSGLCGDSTASCTVNTTGWGGNPTLEGWLADPTLITYLEPEFIVDRTANEIDLVDQDSFRGDLPVLHLVDSYPNMSSGISDHCPSALVSYR